MLLILSLGLSLDLSLCIGSSLGLGNLDIPQKTSSWSSFYRAIWFLAKTPYLSPLREGVSRDPSDLSQVKMTFPNFGSVWNRFFA